MKTKTYLPLYEAMYDSGFNEGDALERALDVINCNRDFQGLDIIDESLVDFDEDRYLGHVADEVAEFMEEFLLNEYGLDVSIDVKRYNESNSPDITIEFDARRLKHIIKVNSDKIPKETMQEYKEKGFEEEHILGDILSALVGSEDETMIKCEEYLKTYISDDDFVRNWTSCNDDALCPECQEALVEESWERAYTKVVKHYRKIWEETQTKPFPKTYALYEWVEKVNPKVCFKCHKE